MCVFPFILSWRGTVIRLASLVNVAIIVRFIYNNRLEQSKSNLQNSVSKFAIIARQLHYGGIWFCSQMRINIIMTVSVSVRLLLATRGDVRLLDAGNPHQNMSVVIDDQDTAAAVDFLYSDNMIFWTDTNSGAIYRLALNDTGNIIEPVVTTGLLSPDGLACDWIGRHLYWADSETKRIEVSELSGTNRKVLYWQHIDMPRAVVLDPSRG